MAKRKGLFFHSRVFIAVIAVFAWCGVSAGAADWKPYAEDPHFSYYYDARKIEYPYKTMHNVMKLELANVDIVRVRTKRIIKGEKGRDWQIQELKKLGHRTQGFEGLEFVIVGEEVNCHEKKYRVLSEAYYSKDGGELNSVVRKVTGDEGWQPIPPHSDDDALYRALCGKIRESASHQYQMEDR